MVETSLPNWEERDEPAMQLHDIDPNSRTYTDPVHPVEATRLPEEALVFMNCVNDIRAPLHQQIRQLYTPHMLRFYGSAVALDIAEITGQPVFPAMRGVDHEEMPRTDTLAVRGTSPSPTPLVSSEDEDALFGIVRMSQKEMETGDAVDVFDGIARGIGGAALKGPVDVYLDTNKPPQISYGSMWRHDGRIVGQLLYKAGIIKLASVIRERYGIMEPAGEAPSPLLSPYVHLNYPEQAAMLAVGIDQINRAAGFSPDQYGLYESLWPFGYAGRRNDAREAMEAIIRRATGGSDALRLEHIEQQSDMAGLPIGVLHRIEEACGIEASHQLSRSYG